MPGCCWGLGDGGATAAAALGCEQGTGLGVGPDGGTFPGSGLGWGLAWGTCCWGICGLGRGADCVVCWEEGPKPWGLVSELCGLCMLPKGLMAGLGLCIWEFMVIPWLMAEAWEVGMA